MYIEVYDQNGELLKNLTAGIRKGVNMVPWYMRMKPPKVPVSAQFLGQAVFGPSFPPGDYTVKVVKGDNTYETTVNVIYDPDSPHSIADRDLRYETIMRSYNRLEDLAYIDHKIIEVRDAAEEYAKSAEIKKSLKKQLTALSEKMYDLRKELLATREGRITGEKRIRERIANIYSNVSAYQGRPTASQLERLDYLEGEIKKFDDRVNIIIDTDLVKLNKALKKADLEVIAFESKEEFMGEEE